MKSLQGITGGLIPTRAALKTSGLPEREALVWYVLATHEPLHITDISRIADLHRPAVYTQLEALIQKGLVEELEIPGRRRYRTTGTRKFTAWARAQERVFVDSLTRLQEEEGEPMPEEMRIYRGKEIRRVWEELAQSPKKTVFYRYDGYPGSLNIDRYIPKEYIEGLKSRGLERFVVTNQALRRRAYQKRVECASRVLPASFDPFEQGISQFIYSDKIALVDFSTETAFVIKNATLADFHRRLFKYLYHTLPE
jgi:sugar-specific transcriptional regulator TrmB